MSTVGLGVPADSEININDQSGRYEPVLLGSTFNLAAVPYDHCVRPGSSCVTMRVRMSYRYADDP